MVFPNTLKSNFKKTLLGSRASLVAQLAKNLPAVQEIQVQSLGWEDSLEKEMATHSSILAWKILGTEKPGRYSLWVHKSRTRLGD